MPAVLVIDGRSERRERLSELLGKAGVEAIAGTDWETVGGAAQNTFIGVVGEISAEDWARLREPIETWGAMLLVCMGSSVSAETVASVDAHDCVGALAALEDATRVPLGPRTADVLRGRVGEESLTPVECALLHALAAAGQAVSREELLTRVWGYRPGVVSRAADTAVRRLRAKLERATGQTWIRTARGVGYLLDTGDKRELPKQAHRRELIGRDLDAARLCTLVGEGGFVTLVGPPGVGKTALARANENAFSPTLWIDAADLSDAEGLWGRIAVRVGCERGDLLETLSLKAPCLLIIDNVEQMVKGAGEVVEGLPEGVTVLLTSREPLGLASERVLRIAPLGVPREEDAIGAARQSASVAMLLAQAVQRGGPIDLPQEQVEAAIGIAVLLDGLPLALEFAASRAAVLGFSEVLRALEQRPGRLASRQRGGLPHHRSLDEAIAWSWDLLNAAERDALEQLASFSIPMPLAALCAGIDVEPFWSDDVVANLVDRSLLQVGSDGWVRMLEPVRQWVQRRSSAGVVREVLARYAVWLDETVPPGPMFDGPGGFDRREALTRQLPDLERALEVVGVERGLRLVQIMARIHDWRGRAASSLALAERALETLEVGPEWARLQATRLFALREVRGAGLAAQAWRDAREAVAMYGDPRACSGFHRAGAYALGFAGAREEAREAAELCLTYAEHTDVHEWARCLGVLAWTQARAGDADGALDLLVQALDRVVHPPDRAHLISLQGAVLFESRRLTEAEPVLRLAIETLDGASMPLASALARNNLAGTLFMMGRLEEARQEMEREVAVYIQAGHSGRYAVARGNLGTILLEMGDAEAAREHLDVAIQNAVLRGERLSEMSFRGVRARALEALGLREQALVDVRWLRREGGDEAIPDALRVLAD